jgi:hypothetical protein
VCFIVSVDPYLHNFSFSSQRIYLDLSYIKYPNGLEDDIK